MAVPGGSFVRDFNIPLGIEQNILNLQSYPLYHNNSTIKVENPNDTNIKLECSDSVIFPPGSSHPQQISPSTSNENNMNAGVTCEFCGKVFENRSLLTKHKAAHAERNRICKFCSRAFHREDKLRRHIASVHSLARPFICEICGKGFARKDKLQEHTKNHDKNQTFPCPECGEVFNMRSKLNKHRREVHNFRQSTRLPKPKPSQSGRKKKVRNSEVTPAQTESAAIVPISTDILQNTANLIWRQGECQPSLSNSAFGFWNPQNPGQFYPPGYNHFYYAAAAMRQNSQQSFAAHMFSQVAANGCWPTNLTASISTDTQQPTRVSNAADMISQVATNGCWPTNLCATGSTDTQQPSRELNASIGQGSQRTVSFNAPSFPTCSQPSATYSSTPSYYDAATLAASLGQNQLYQNRPAYGYNQ